MRKLFVDDLPKWKEGRYEGKIKWKDSIGHIVKFIYDDIVGEIEIIDYKDYKLLLKYKDESTYMNTQHFSNCNISKLISGSHFKYKYKIDEIIENVNSGKLKITEQIKVHKQNGYVKAYHYNCLICNNVDIITENKLDANRGCNVCAGKKVLKGYNDIWTVRPDIAILFKNPEVGYLLSVGSNKKEDFKCLNCGYEINNKTIVKICKYGISCPKCSDGISYPEKFVFNLLQQLNIIFEKQKIFEWARNKKYDFYIPSKNCIIETHGLQHYEDTGFKDGKTYLEEQENDRLKKQLAKDNGVENYIVINCSRSELAYIKNNIYKSELSKIKLFDLTIIDWLKCHEFSCNTLVKTVCNLWNSGVKDTKQIGELASLKKCTVIKYLKQGTELGWCIYDPAQIQRENGKLLSKLNRKKTVQLTIDSNYIKTWDSATEAGEALGISKNGISLVCTGRYKKSGGFKWMFKEDYDQYIKHAQ